MMHSKNHKGFSFIEMMVALAMLAIFGTSIMIVQTSLFEKLIKGHTKLLNMFVIDQYIVQFNEQVQQALQDKTSVETIALHHDNKNPEYTVDIKINPVATESALAKKFGSNIGITQITVKNNEITDTWYTLISTKSNTEPKKNNPEQKAPPTPQESHEA